MNQAQSLFERMTQVSLVLRIVVGIVLGTLIAVVSPTAAGSVSILGSLFVRALQAVAPILVFVLVMSSIANQKKGQHSNIKPIIGLYLVGTLAAAFTAVVVSFISPVTLSLVTCRSQCNASGRHR